MKSKRRSDSTMARQLLPWVALSTCVVLGGCAKKDASAQTPTSKPTSPPAAGPARVKVLTPTRTHLKRESTPQPAQVAGYEKTDIHAKVSGYVQQFGQVRDDKGRSHDLDMGDRVVKDQVLVVLAVPEMDKELELKKALQKQAEAEVKKHEAELKFRDAELARIRDMVREKSVRESVLDEKQYQRDAVAAAIAVAVAREHVALREKEHLESLLSYATIKAPFNGIITRRLVDTGAFVASAAGGKPGPLFTLARVDRLRIIGDVPEAEANLVKIGQPAAFRVRGQALAGKVVRFADALDSSTRTMRVELELTATTQALRPGMFGSMTILLVDVPDALMVPGSALVPGEAPAVFVVDRGKVQKRRVELGSNDGGRVQIVGGLTGNEQVVAEGKSRLRDGDAVEIAP